MIKLPDGENYCNAFQGYAPDRLAKFFNNDLNSFCRSWEKLGGIPVDIGDAGFSIELFPRISVTIAYHLGEDAFPPGASLLFDGNVSHYMLTAGMASIGSHLVTILIENSGY